jgi:hypothetical protein
MTNPNRSQLDNIGEGEKALVKLFNGMTGHLRRIAVNTSAPDTAIDSHLSEPGVTGSIELARQVKGPLAITDIFATWETPDTAQNQQSILIPQPGAGASAVYTNNTGQPQNLVSASATFTTSATVANRFAQLTIFDASGNILALLHDATAIVASSTLTFSAYQGASQQNSASGTFTGPLPQGLAIPPGGSVSFNANGIQTGDQWSNAVVVVDADTSSVTLIIGDRNIPLDPSTGLFAMSFTRPMLVDNSQKITLQILPAGVASFMEFHGYADTRIAT